MTNSNSDRFLDLEERANELVAQLQELAKLVKSYDEVSRDLARASNGLFTATTQYTDVAQQVGHVATTMRQVGMPDLLDAVHQGRRETTGNLDALRTAMHEAQQAVDQWRQETTGSLDALGATMHEAQQAAAASSEDLLSAINQAVAHVTALQSAANETALEQSHREAARTRLFVVIGAVLATAAGVAATAAPFLNLT